VEYSDHLQHYRIGIRIKQAGGDPQSGVVWLLPICPFSTKDAPDCSTISFSGVHFAIGRHLDNTSALENKESNRKANRNQNFLDGLLDKMSTSRLLDGAVAGRGCSRSSARPTTRSLTRKFVPTFCQILETSLFAQSDALARYLRFTVETTLDGKADTLKEYVIGTAVYDRQPSYSPGEDSIVCSEARRLRRKLHKYYGPVATCLPSGR
jgi:hypothetical protein